MSNYPERSKVTEAAASLAKLRWKGTTKAERKEAAKKASAGRMVKLTPEQRSAIAAQAGSAISRKAAQARAQKAWETRRKRALQAV